MYNELGPACPPWFSGRAASGPWDSITPTTLSSHAKGQADHKKIAARHTAAPQRCPKVAMELWWAAAELAATGRSCHWEMHREAGKLPLTPVPPLLPFLSLPTPRLGGQAPSVPNCPEWNCLRHPVMPDCQITEDGEQDFCTGGSRCQG